MPKFPLPPKCLQRSLLKSQPIQIRSQDVLQIDVWKDEILSREVTVRPDGKGRVVDNVFVERRRRSVKYEEVFLRAYDSPAIIIMTGRNFTDRAAPISRSTSCKLEQLQGQPYFQV